MSLKNILSKKDANLLLELIQDSLVCRNTKKLGRLFEKLKNIIQFDYSVAALAEVDYTGKLVSDHVINLNYPDDWITIYKQRKYYTVDPVIKELFFSAQLQYWPNAYKKHCSPKEFISLANDFKLIEGYTYGLTDKSETRNLFRNTVFSFAGKGIEENKRTEYILLTIIPHFHNAFMQILAHHQLKKCNISMREREVLKWLRQGKSSWDISHILGISERTVNFHTSNILTKLNAVTRAQAVGNAMHLGLIEY